MIRYMRVDWLHAFEDEPVVLYSEVIDGFENRKVEAYRDGRTDFASGQSQTGTTRLSGVLMPTVHEVAKDAEFVAVEISEEDFESVWRRAVAPPI